MAHCAFATLLTEEGLELEQLFALQLRDPVFHCEVAPLPAEQLGVPLGVYPLWHLSVQVPPKGVFSHLVFVESMFETTGSDEQGTGEHELVRPLHEPSL